LKFKASQQFHGVLSWWSEFALLGQRGERKKTEREREKGRKGKRIKAFHILSFLVHIHSITCEEIKN
jgi:hypothetical protein